MEYLKIWTNFVECMEPLNDSEKGRLFVAMLEYASEGKLPELKGNERFTWPTAKQSIDRARAESDKQTVNGSKGGRPKKNPENQTVISETQQNPQKPNETQQNPTKPTETQQNPKYNIKKNNIKEKIQKENVGYFGMEISDEDTHAYMVFMDRVEDACLKWGLPCKPGNLEKAQNLAETYSEDWLFKAIERCGDGKSQTWGYVEGILKRWKTEGFEDGTERKVKRDNRRIIE